MSDNRYRFTLHADADRPPARHVVRVFAGGGWDPENARAYPTRTYLRTEDDDWMREDEVEREPLAVAVSAAAAVRRSWRELLEREQLLTAVWHLNDTDFDGIEDLELRCALIEAGSIFGSVLDDVAMHHCSGGSWGDHSLFGPAAELADLLDAMAQVGEAITEARQRLRLLRMHVGRHATERWRADLAALRARIRQGGTQQ